MLSTSKRNLRKKILQQRQQISFLKWQKKSTLISNNLQNWYRFQEAKTIFAYFSFRQEPSLSSLFSSSKKWGFPRCVDKSLVWHLWQPGDCLSIDKYGIKTPRVTAPIVTPGNVDLILVPCVACDQNGYRLGYGGGFYDRFLSSFNPSSIVTVGIVFDFAYISELPKDPWDIPLNFICTETQIITITLD